MIKDSEDKREKTLEIKSMITIVLIASLLFLGISSLAKHNGVSLKDEFHHVMIGD